jgi:hypothetical protein
MLCQMEGTKWSKSLTEQSPGMYKENIYSYAWLNMKMNEKRQNSVEKLGLHSFIQHIILGTRILNNKL